MPHPSLSDRALNRALLARQLLLERAPIDPVTAVGRLVAMQAQLAKPPYVGLWSRLAGFKREELTAAVEARTLVRATFVRATLHLLTTADYLRFRGAVQPVLDGAAAAVLKARAMPVAEAEVLAAAREAFARPSSFEAVRDRLLARFPDADERGMGYLVRMRLPLVQVPTGGPWGFPASADFVAAEAWLGEPPAAGSELEALALRYIASHGPAGWKDMQTWSGLKGLKAVFEGLRPRLVTFTDPRGRELFDLPDAPRPDEDTPAPPRFLPDFDGLVLGLDDRTRFIDDAHRPLVYQAKNLRVLPSFMLDGRVAGTWSIKATKKKATLGVAPFATPGAADREAIAAEALSLARFLEPEVRVHDVVFGEEAGEG